MSVTALRRRPITPAWDASDAALAGDTHERHAVHEAAGALADGDEAIVGRGRRGQEDGLDVVRVGGFRPPAELVERKIGEDGGGDAGVAQCSREPPVAHVAHRVGVGHHHERHVDLELRGVADDARGGRTEVERAPRCLLDGETVHHRIGERDADLDGVGTGGGDGPHDVEPTGTETTGDIGDQELAARLPAGAQMRLQAHPCPLTASRR